MQEAEWCILSSIKVSKGQRAKDMIERKGIPEMERMRSEIGIMLNAFTKSIRASKHQSINVTEIQSSDAVTL